MMVLQASSTCSSLIDQTRSLHMAKAWWRHQMETFSAILAICAGNSPVPGEFPTQRPVTWSFDVFFDLRLNKWFSKQSWGWWFETLSPPLWRHRNGVISVPGGWHFLTPIYSSPVPQEADLFSLSVSVFYGFLVPRLLTCFISVKLWYRYVTYINQTCPNSSGGLAKLGRAWMNDYIPYIYTSATSYPCSKNQCCCSQSLSAKEAPGNNLWMLLKVELSRSFLRSH